MPVFDSRTVIELARGIRAFLKLEAGLTRGEIPARDQDVSEQPDSHAGELARVRMRLEEKEREIAGLKQRLAAPAPMADGVSPENVVWIFCSNRSGSTWLSSMMGEVEGHEVWNEPLVGKLFGDLYYVGAAGHEKVKHYILGDYHKGSWLDSIQSFVLSEATARFPEVAGRGYLIIKEPNGSIGAPLLSEAMPASRVIFLVRDPRDVAASGLDAARKGSWQYENAADRGWKREALADNQPDVWVRRRAQNYVRHAGKARDAYEAHKGPKVLIRYEELREDALGTMERLYSTLGIQVREEELARAVEKHAWENIPEKEKGQGKFYRRAKPGGWREDLTPAQVEIVEQVSAPLLKEFYPG
ncbi:MAG TPA: sulfotransferase domain-containing protein [Rubrobacter sp.]|nr:sulfotransferase domain-containing protein [Rubrobacter sp.]